MITFEEFIGKGNKVSGEIMYPKNYIIKKAIEYAKLHCIEQARVISEKANTDLYNYISTGNLPDKDSILSAYSLDNIK